MGCGCRDRADALKKAAIAISEGRSEDAYAEMRRFGQSAVEDAGKIRDAMAASAARVRHIAVARLRRR